MQVTVWVVVRNRNWRDRLDPCHHEGLAPVARKALSIALREGRHSKMPRSDTHTFIAPTPINRLRQLAEKGSGLVAVPFLGANAHKLLPLKRGSVLVTRVTVEDVKQGLVSPKEVLRYLKTGVEIHNCSNLHAKVYVFGRRAIVGSPNVSATSARLVEAAVEVSETGLVAQARAFIRGLQVDPVSAEFAASLLCHYREDRVGGWSAERAKAAAPRSKSTHAEHSRMLVLPLVEEEWTQQAKEIAKAKRDRAKDAMSDPDKHRLVEVECDNTDWRRLRVGDRMIQRFKKGRSFEFEPPARLIMIEPYVSGRGAVLFLERRKRLRDVGSAELRAHLGVAARHFCAGSDSPLLVRSGEAVAKVVELWPALNR